MYPYREPRISVITGSPRYVTFPKAADSKRTPIAAGAALYLGLPWRAA